LAPASPQIIKGKEMKILQTYYTSCKKGQLGGAGFQFYSYSEGLSSEEQKEISILGNYLPPFNLPTQPTPEERESLFPVAFSYFKLKSGKAGICQSKYIGQDYSGRYGNFFSHCLILEAGDFPFHPIQMFQHPVFRDHLTVQEEEATEKPALLPTFDISELKPVPVTEFELLGDFLSVGREGALKQIMDALICFPATNRRVILADEPQHALLWLKAITLALPLQLAKEITFTTYAFDPTNTSFNLCYTLNSGIRFDFNNQMAKDFQFYLFDISTQNCSKVEYESSFSKMLPLAFTISADKLIHFHQFLEYFNYQTLDKDIDDALGLFNLIKGSTTLPQLSYPDINRYFSYAMRYDRGEYILQLIDFINLKNNSYYLIEKLKSFEQSAFIVKILFAASCKSVDIRQKNFSCDFYADSVIEFINYQGEGLSIDRLKGFVDYNTTILGTSFAQSEYFTNYILSIERIHTMDQLLEEFENNKEIQERKQLSCAMFCAIILGVYAENRELAGHFRSFLLKRITSLASEQNYLYPIFAELAKKASLFFEILKASRERLSLQSQQLEQLYQAFLRVYNQHEPNWKSIVNNELFKNNEVELILRMASTEIQTAENKAAAFEKYLDKYSQFFKIHANRFSTFLLEYAMVLTTEYPKAGVIKLLDYATFISDTTFHHKLIEILEDKINPANPNKIEPGVIEKIHQLRLKILPGPVNNGLEYIYYGLQLEQEKIDLAEFIKKIAPLGKLNSKRQSEVLKWLLHLIFEELDQKAKYKYLTAFLATNISESELKNALHVLFSYSYGYDTELTTLFISYLAFEEQKEGKNQPTNINFQEILKLIKTAIPEILTAQKQSFLDKVGRKLPEDAYSEKYWRALCRKSEQLREENPDKGIVKSIKSLWGRK